MYNTVKYTLVECNKSLLSVLKCKTVQYIVVHTV